MPLSLEFEHLDGVIYAANYANNPQIQAAVAQFKYRFTKELTKQFSDLLAEKIRELKMVNQKKIVFIPVPLHEKRLRYRGFNQAELIADALQERMGDRSCVISMIARVRHTHQQAKLSKGEREKNLEDAFRMKAELPPYDPDALYFVVDDVCTTGATLENCAKTLKGAGIEKVYGLVVARALR